MKLKRKIKFALRKNNMSQSELAKAMGVSDSGVSRWINENRDLQASNIKSLCETLNISADWLLDVKGDKKCY